MLFANIPAFPGFPVGCGNSVKEELVVLVSDTLPVLVNAINTVLFEAPYPVWEHGTDAAFLGLFFVKCHIHRHALAHKVVQ